MAWLAGALTNVSVIWVGTLRTCVPMVGVASLNIRR